MKSAGIAIGRQPLQFSDAKNCSDQGELTSPTGPGLTCQNNNHYQRRI